MLVAINLLIDHFRHVGYCIQIKNVTRFGPENIEVQPTSLQGT